MSMSLFESLFVLITQPSQNVVAEIIADLRIQCRFLGFKLNGIEPIKQQASQYRDGSKPECAVLPDPVAADLAGKKLSESLDGRVPRLVLRQDVPVVSAILKIARNDGKKASGSQAARSLDNIKFEIQAHQVALAAVSLKPQQLLILHEACTPRGGRRGQFCRDFVDPIRQHPPDARHDDAMPAAPGLNVRQCVVEVAVQRTVVDEAAAGRLAVDQVVQAHIEEVSDGEQLGEAGPGLLADVL